MTVYFSEFKAKAAEMNSVQLLEAKLYDALAGKKKEMLPKEEIESSLKYLIQMLHFKWVYLECLCIGKQK